MKAENRFKHGQKSKIAHEKAVLSAKMLFPPQRGLATDSITRKSASEKEIKAAAAYRNKKKAWAKENKVRYWTYLLGDTVENLMMHIRSLPKSAPIRTEDHLLASTEITLEPREYDPSSDTPFVFIKEDLLRFVTQPPRELKDDAKRRCISGQVAGWLLLYVYYLQEMQLKPSLTKAETIFNDLYPKRFDRKPGRPRKLDAGFDTHFNGGELSDAWSQYSPVAHFWAALLVLKNDKITYSNRPLKDIDIVALLKLAKFFAEFGLGFLAKHATVGTNLLKEREIVRHRGKWLPKIIASSDFIPNRKIEREIKRIFLQKGGRPIEAPSATL